MREANPELEPRRLPRSPRRLLLAGLGVLCVGLALVGVVVPGLPTTVFLIAASYLFARSCPWLEEKLLGHPAFRPFMPYVRGERAMPRRARVAALLMMWGAVTASLTTLALAGRLPLWLGAGLLAAAVAGSYAIATYAPRAAAPAGATSPPSETSSWTGLPSATSSRPRTVR